MYVWTEEGPNAHKINVHAAWELLNIFARLRAFSVQKCKNTSTYKKKKDQLLNMVDYVHWIFLLFVMLHFYGAQEEYVHLWMKDWRASFLSSASESLINLLHDIHDALRAVDQRKQNQQKNNKNMET